MILVPVFLVLAIFGVLSWEWAIGLAAVVTIATFILRGANWPGLNRRSEDDAVVIPVIDWLDAVTKARRRIASRGLALSPMDFFTLVLAETGGQLAGKLVVAGRRMGGQERLAAHVLETMPPNALAEIRSELPTAQAHDLQRGLAAALERLELAAMA
jgi:hypothetical protein